MTATLTLHADTYQPGTRHRPHRHDELHLSLVLTGHILETVGQETECAGALSVVAKDAGVVHANEFGTASAKLAKLTLRSGTIAALVDDPARAAAWRWTHDVAAAKPFLRLIRRAGPLPSAIAADDADVLDLLAAVTARRAAPARGSPPAWLVQTIAELQTHWLVRRSVRDIAQRAGVHPVYLARCVRRWYGSSIGGELRRLRARSAAQAVARSRATISSVAYAHGYADEPHLCREFQRAAGITPGRYRALVKTFGYAWRGHGHGEEGFADSSFSANRWAK